MELEELIALLEQCNCRATVFTEDGNVIVVWDGAEFQPGAAVRNPDDSGRHAWAFPAYKRDGVTDGQE